MYFYIIIWYFLVQIKNCPFKSVNVFNFCYFSLGVRLRLELILGFIYATSTI